ncbi:HAD-IIB family hydrolase [Spirochaeta isovalerica]|uniref:sucrose-phosphate synthase n=1 Tax=Spirochaeta isovalerica TaxID=150 RepID=A0A841RDC9_9SPIO|nr:HAD-IIB family hydrolase [Spirochaeta isovalerica]MBB6481391.1 sucrose-phosphate synthase [Spirochaeta isovalerica]
MMINIHGLVRSSSLEFGRDADTGGQTRYVVDLAVNLSESESVSSIDLVTRQIKDKVVSPVYGEKIETINEKSRIVRLPCGGNKYLHKEKLWGNLEEFTDNLIAFIRSQDRIPDVVHGHYADGGYVALQIAETFGIPFVFTAHSLGRNKLAFLTSNGWSEKKADSAFNIRTRIDVEEEILERADMVIASTNYEKEDLYGQYSNRSKPYYKIIPPGIMLDTFFPYYYYEVPGNNITEEAKQAHIRLQNELRRFHFETEKPLIVTLCRPDARKNIDVLIDVYGKDKELQAMANLAIFAGIRDDIAEMEEGEQQVLTDILLAMDKYDLYGKMAIPKYHDATSDVPELYRITALKGGVFVSASYLETFGLTFIEASASGLPFVATNKGGPVDIEKNCRSGVLVDIANPESISEAIKKIITDHALWSELSQNGTNRTREVYTWGQHCRTYLSALETLPFGGNREADRPGKDGKIVGNRINRMKNLLIVDIDDTLLGDDEATGRVRQFIEANRDTLGFGVATGRDIDSTKDVLSAYGFDDVDILITSVGTEIYYGPQLRQDRGWQSHIRSKWKLDQVRRALAELPFLSLQETPEAQRDYKVSYILDSSADPRERIPLIHNALTISKLSYTLVYSHGFYIDILPARASKGKAVSYLSGKWQISRSHIVAAGNSGNDRDMLTGSVRGVVVSNYEKELEALKKNKSVYFSKAPYGDGVLEGMKYWLGREDYE